MLYNLWEDGAIVSRELKGRGKNNGKRLWNMASIRRYIEASPEVLGESVDESENEKTPSFPMGPNTITQSFSTFSLPAMAGVSPTVLATSQHYRECNSH